MKKLKPCPFCGSMGLMLYALGKREYKVSCCSCDSFIEFHVQEGQGIKEASAMWNSRAFDDLHISIGRRNLKV